MDDEYKCCGKFIFKNTALRRQILYWNWSFKKAVAEDACWVLKSSSLESLRYNIAKYRYNCTGR
eukprot:Pgem_evm1s1403